ncbi:MAG TPA: hypothetical protein VEI06_02775 [Gemmatimonadaceae bacterium]|nr:hypothetical protein [Gemmatimonadaceae bacterium]
MTHAPSTIPPDRIAVAAPVEVATVSDDLTRAVADGIPLARALRPRGAPPSPPPLTALGAREPEYVAAGGSRTVAVIVVHGMGQQVPFETLHSVADALWREHTGADLTATDLRVRYARFGTEWVPRAELELTNGKRRTVHLYEAYWAPLTEGRATALDVVRFLLNAAYRGFREQRGGFERWMFGRTIVTPVSRVELIGLALAALAVALSPLLYFLFWILAGATAVGELATPTARALVVPLVGALAIGASLLLITTLAAGYSLAIGTWLVRRVLPSTVRRKAWGVLALMLAAAIAAPGIAASFWRERLDLGGPWHVLLVCAVLLALAFLLDTLRGWTAQYVGDVVVYVSAHTVSKFAETRARILQVGRSLARSVYGAHVAPADGGAPELVYDDVIVVGHSLGSVIAYDMLNDSIQRDLALAAQRSATLHVVDRTRLFLTCGSPLDKTAFFFRCQADSLPTREALAAATQPMILDYGNRPEAWVNLWSPWDWIGGPIDFYDAMPVHPARLDPSHPPDPRSVINLVDEEASAWLASAHTEYWSRSEFRRRLHQAVWT